MVSGPSPWLITYPIPAVVHPDPGTVTIRPPILVNRGRVPTTSVRPDLDPRPVGGKRLIKIAYCVYLHGNVGVSLRRLQRQGNHPENGGHYCKLINFHGGFLHYHSTRFASLHSNCLRSGWQRRWSSQRRSFRPFVPRRFTFSTIACIPRSTPRLQLVWPRIHDGKLFPARSSRRLRPGSCRYSSHSHRRNISCTVQPSLCP